MSSHPQRLCAEHEEIELFGSRPSRNSIHMASAYICDSPDVANQRLGGQVQGYAYQRDGHPNADVLAEKCRKLHQAEEAVVTSSGMSAVSLAMVACLQAGDHVLLSHRLFGRTPALVQGQFSRFGITSSTVNLDQPDPFQAVPAQTRMIIVETISNPNLHVVDIQALSKTAQEMGAILMVDNTFASPILFRPLEHGADLVVESLTKIMNGHGDVTMGLLCGKSELWERVPAALSNWGMTTGPMGCWLAERGLGTLYLRVVTASQNAKRVASELESHPALEQVRYPGLESHEGFENSSRQFLQSQGETLYGNMVSLRLRGGWDSAARFIEAARNIDYCPSLGELSTTLSHPASSSHRSLSDGEMKALGISKGTIRLSVGIEDSESIINGIKEALVGMDS